MSMSSIWSNITEQAIRPSMYVQKQKNVGGNRNTRRRTNLSNHKNNNFVNMWTQPLHQAVKSKFASRQAGGGGLSQRRRRYYYNDHSVSSQEGGFIRGGHRYYYTPQLSTPPVTQMQDNMGYNRIKNNDPSCMHTFS